MSVEVKIKYTHLRIYIDGLLHSSIKVDEIVGIQSYLHGKQKYYINYTTKTNTVETMYVKKCIWERILKQLDKLAIV